jgi:hypothetical protein
MKSVQVQDILERQIDHVLGHLIYVVRDGDVVFYVGQSKRDVVMRFWEHMNKPSRLGQLIALNRPQSMAWSVDFYTLADCQPFVRQQSLFSLQEWQHFDMDMAERGMIAQMCPVINRDFNANPTPLPARYYGREVIGEAQEVVWQAQDRPWLNRMSLAGWVYVRDGENGRILWRHQNGTLFTDEVVAPYRQRGTLPPNHDG